MRDWVTNLSTTHYLVGSAIGPHPFPTIVRDFQKVISEEIKLQMKEQKGKLPDAVVACVGGGSNAIGTFYDFIGDKSVRLIGVEAGGEGEQHRSVLIMWSTDSIHRNRWGAAQRYSVHGCTGRVTWYTDVPPAVAFGSDHRDTFDQRWIGLSWSWTGARLVERVWESGVCRCH